MNYATTQEVINRFERSELVQLTDDNDIGAIDEIKLNKALDDAGAFMDGYIGGRYQLPLSEVPRSLVRFACNLARYFLYDDHAPDHVAKDYDEAVKYLEGVSKGQIKLSLTDTQGKVAQTNQSKIEHDGHVFSRKTDGYI